MTTEPYRFDELMIDAMARELSGEVLVSSVTAFGALAGLVAKAFYAPDLALLATPESGMDVDFLPSLSLGQFFILAQRGIALGMEEVFDAIFLDKFRIWINPAQIDQRGSVNISTIGPWANPKVALVGSRGIPEDTSHLSKLCYYLLDHNPRTVVAAVDFRSGAGNTAEREQRLGRIGAPSVLVTNLGVFDFQGAHGQMQIRQLHPGVDLTAVESATGFHLTAASPVATTPEPSSEVVAFIRQHDPLGLRHMEMQKGSGAAKHQDQAWMDERSLLEAPSAGEGAL
ncbi:MAG: CoA-transferase [Firmicutes bacterium]|jgi:glutaconate CoA-transferase subunit B|nr:CoA-transferase [Bacillota bacterium]MCL5063604.1 CoA-transferase [Bacillota bacterium]